MNPEHRYFQIKNLVANIPDLSDPKNISAEARQWLGRSAALLQSDEDRMEYIQFKIACDSLGSMMHDSSVNTIISTLYRALARAELAAPAIERGAFIPAREPFAALSAIAKVFGSASVALLIVDPYADANLLIDFAVLAQEDVSIQILTDENGYKAGLKPAAENWRKQYFCTRPLEIRIAPKKTLHDRVIFVDEKDTWILGQSFNNLATRSPTALQRLEQDTSSMKFAAYSSLWKSAKSLT